MVNNIDSEFPSRLSGLLHALASARKEKGLTQKALAQRLGIPQSRLSKIESGTVDVRSSTIIELARVLEMELVLVPRKLVPAMRTMILQDVDPVLSQNTSRWLYSIQP